MTRRDSESGRATKFRTSGTVTDLLEGHAFHANGHAERYLPRANAVRDIPNRHETRGAKPIDSRDRDAVGNPSCQRGSTRDV
jgi:hypothetical protein